MKRACLMILLLLSAIPAAFPQAFRLDVDDKPLSRVLDLLDVEISFDERALSAYSVSVSETFGSREEALFRLLENKPFRVEKIGNVYVIIPDAAGGKGDASATSPRAAKERLAFTGTVTDGSSRERLEYATVSLLHPDGKPFLTGITTDGGRFFMETAERPESMKISYIGYETCLIDLRGRHGELGVFPLKEAVVPLGETVVITKPSKLNRIIYTVTSRMRDGAGNALELTGRIPGVSFDKSSETVMINNRTNILLLVDGIEYPQAWLKHLSPHRVHAVEVTQASSGRFVSDDYAAIVRFILKKDYTGYDIHVSGAASWNLSASNAYTRLAESLPEVGATFTTRKWNFFGACSYRQDKRNMYSDKHLTYQTVELVSLPAKQPNSLDENTDVTLSGGLNYRITPAQLVGIQGDYSSGNMYTFRNHAMRRTDLTNNENRAFANTTEILTKARTLTGSLFYEGQVTNRLHLHADFSYNYYYNEIENEYRQGETAGYRYDNSYNEYKNQTVFNAEGKYVLSERLSAEAGYSNIRRHYASTSSRGIGFLDYSEQRNKAYAYLSYDPSDRMGLKSGVALEHTGTQYQEIRHAYVRLLPFFQVAGRISRAVHLLAGYATHQSYPSLYQLSPMSMAIDTFLTQIGNPSLKSAVGHRLFAEFTLWGEWRIVPQVDFVRDGISEVYDIREYKLYRTFDNIHTREYSLQVTHDRTVGTCFRLKNAFTLYHGEALHKNVRTTLNDWLLLSEVNYYHPDAAWGAQVGYYRKMKKNILWQGYQMSDRDYWCLSVQKELWRNRVSVMLSYIPPVASGVRYDRLKEVHTPLYGEKTTLHLNSYNQMLLLKINVRFERGGIKPTGKPSPAGNSEREK